MAIYTVAFQGNHHHAPFPSTQLPLSLQSLRCRRRRRSCISDANFRNLYITARYFGRNSRANSHYLKKDCRLIACDQDTLLLCNTNHSSHLRGVCQQVTGWFHQPPQRTGQTIRRRFERLGRNDLQRTSTQHTSRHRALWSDTFLLLYFWGSSVRCDCICTNQSDW